jgi:transcriptional regulator with XRE-family HTH domain
MPPPLPDQAALGRAVLAIRAEKGLSQVQLAQATGFRQSWLSDTEHGRRNPSWSNVIRLATGLGVSVSELAARAEALARQPPDNSA